MPDAANITLPVQPSTAADPRLVDRFGRVHTKLRVSVTDRCNLRCTYCMPAAGIAVAPKESLLTFEEIERVVRLVAGLGVRQVRLTGGEPLVRRDMPVLVERLAGIAGLEDLSMTTNAVVLDTLAAPLRRAGLQRVNISLDALDPEVFRRVTRRDGYDRVLAGIEAAREASFDPIKINVVSTRGVTDNQVVPFGHFARDTGMEVRFIEYMPLDGPRGWSRDRVLSGAEIRGSLSSAILPLIPVGDPTGSPATEYEFADGVGRIGFIPTVTAPFCAKCD
ncbi:MAG: GTP 3',8-cyclase MoaA, partial [Planctomycetota bacterium]